MTTKITTVKNSPWTPEQISLLTRTVARGATQDELGLFFNIAKRAGLDPFTKQIHFVKRKVWNNDKKSYEEVGTTQTGIDGYRAIADRSGNYAGSDDAIFDSETEQHPQKAIVTVYRIVGGQRSAFTASARWSEYAPINPKTNEIMGQWKKMPYLMLSKCAESLALRKAFPNDLSGLYTEEEMEQANVESKVIEVEIDEKKSKVEEEKKNEMAELMHPVHKMTKEKSQALIESLEKELTPENIEKDFMTPDEAADRLMQG